MSATLNGGYARINPELELLKNGTVVATSASGYQRHVVGHTSSSNTIAWVDPDPNTGDYYELRAQQGATQNDVLNISKGHFDAVATKKKEVVQTITSN